MSDWYVLNVMGRARLVVASPSDYQSVSNPPPGVFINPDCLLNKFRMFTGLG